MKFLVDAQLPYEIALMLIDKGFDTINCSFSIPFRIEI